MNPVEQTVPSTDQSAQQEALRRHLARLAWLYDGVVRLPGGLSVGLDAVLGLIPGFGDVLGLILGVHLIYRSWQLGVPAALQRRMLGNLVVDALAGLLPGIGDIVDLLFRANARNIALLQAHLDPATAPPPPRPPRWQGLRWVALSGLLALLALGAWRIGF